MFCYSMAPYLNHPTIIVGTIFMIATVMWNVARYSLDGNSSTLIQLFFHVRIIVPVHFSIFNTVLPKNMQDSSTYRLDPCRFQQMNNSKMRVITGNFVKATRNVFDKMPNVRKIFCSLCKLRNDIGLFCNGSIWPLCISIGMTCNASTASLSGRNILVSGSTSRDSARFSMACSSAEAGDYFVFR